jgi:hypothetical protein
LSSAIQAEIDAEKALEAGKSQLKQQVADTRVVRKDTRALRGAIRKYIPSVYGTNANQVLEDFGFSVPKKTGPKKVAVKAEANAKALATRKAKKEAIDKVVSGPPAATAAASVSTTPAKS